MSLRIINTKKALIKAIKTGNLYIATGLVENVGIDKALDDEGFTPLMIAVKFAQLDIIDFLLENNADVLKATPKGVSIVIIQKEYPPSDYNLRERISFRLRQAFCKQAIIFRSKAQTSS